MSSAVLEAPPGIFASPRGEDSLGGRELTLEERLQSVWRSAQREGIAECPVCRAAMRPAGAAARCEGCDSVVL